MILNGCRALRCAVKRQHSCHSPRSSFSILTRPSATVLARRFYRSETASQVKVNNGKRFTEMLKRYEAGLPLSAEEGLIRTSIACQSGEKIDGGAPDLSPLLGETIFANVDTPMKYVKVRTLPPSANPFPPHTHTN